MTKKNSHSDNAATQEQRLAVTFKAVDSPFNWTNEEWGLHWLPHVRVASLQLQRDDKELQNLMQEMVRKGIVPDVLEDLAETKEHLQALVELLDTALTRSFLVLERLGFSPDEPPPDKPVI